MTAPSIPPLNPDGSAAEFYTDDMYDAIEAGPDKADLSTLLRQVDALRLDVQQNTTAVREMNRNHVEAVGMIREVYEGINPLVDEIRRNPAKFLMGVLTGKSF